MSERKPRNAEDKVWKASSRKQRDGNSHFIVEHRFTIDGPTKIFRSVLKTEHRAQMLDVISQEPNELDDDGSAILRSCEEVLGIKPKADLSPHELGEYRALILVINNYRKIHGLMARRLDLIDRRCAKQDTLEGYRYVKTTMQEETDLPFLVTACTLLQPAYNSAMKRVLDLGTMKKTVDVLMTPSDTADRPPQLPYFDEI